MDNKGEIVIYQTQDGTTQLDVRLDGETVWITQDQMAQLFQRDRTAIGRHISNIFSEGELDRNVVCANFAHTTLHGAKLHRYMYMSDYMALLEDLIRVNKRPVLAGKGQVSAEQAKEHALDELKKFKERRLSPAEEDYMETIRALNEKAKKGMGKK